MKKIFAGTPHTKFIAAASALTWTITMANSVGAAQLQEARVTQVVNDVKLLLEQSAPRPAAVSDLVRRGNAVRTGTQSRSELTFADLTITRLGANTIFSFKEGTREMNLIDGAILFQVPKGSGGATIRTVGVTAAITGTTGIAEFHPATTSHPQLSKWLCLEGTFHLYLPNGQSVEVGPGKMVTTDGKSFSKVSTFDIAKLVSTSLFFTGFDQPLASMNLIMLESENQLANSLFATSTTNPLDPARIVNVTSQAIVAEETQTSPPASPTPPVTPTPPPPTPSKFGTPSVISSPVPYLITSGTVIKTDPSITTNGVTNFGTLYRGPEDDGAFSLWAFGSTSAVDNALDFDTHFNDAGHFPAAAFKFTSLVLAGNPTIDLSNSGVTNLALISVGDITSALPGGTLTFTGLDALLLASQDGSINLGSEITFQDIPTLFFYARGTNGDLTLASSIVGTTDLFLYAGRNITFNAGTNLILGGQFSARSAGGNISVSESGNISVGGSLSVTTDASNVQNGANIFVSSGGDMLIGGSFALSVFAGDDSTTGTGGNIDVHSGGSLTAGNLNFTSRFDPSIGVTEGANVSLNVAGNLTTTAGGITLRHSTPVGSPTATLADGGNLSLMVGGNLTTAPGAGLTLDIINTSGSSVLNGANIFASIGGDLTAESVTLRSSNNGNGSTGTGSNLTLEVGGGINASNFSAELNNISGGHIGTGGNIAVSIGGDLTTTATTGDFDLVVRNTNGLIDNGGNITLNVGGNASTQGQLSLLVENYDETASPAGHIGTGGNISLATGGNLTADSMSVAINNRNGGRIDSSASLMLNIGGTLTTLHNGTDFLGGTESLSLAVSSRYENTLGSTIGGDATLLFHSDSASIGGNLSAIISDVGGTIDGNALLNFSVTHDITIQGDADIEITSNDGPNIGSPIGGTIHGNANLELSAVNLSAGSLLIDIKNNNTGVVGPGGTIDSSANITFNLSGNLTTQTDASFAIRNNYTGPGGIGGIGGTIGQDAVLNINANSLSIGGTLDTSIHNGRNAGDNGGTIGGNATINLVVSGGITALDDSQFIGNGGGTIGSNAAIIVTAASLATTDTAPGALSASINNSGGGNIGGSASINFDLSGNLTSASDATFSIDNTGGSIGGNGDATINVTAANISVGTPLAPADLGVFIYNTGGTIGGSVATNLNVSGDITVAGAINAFLNNGGATSSAGSHITGDATINVLGATGINAGNGAFFAIVNEDAGAGTFGGTIDGNALVHVTADHLSTEALAPSEFNLFGTIHNRGGSIVGNSDVMFDISGAITTAGTASFDTLNFDDGGVNGGGIIGGDARVSINAGALSIGDQLLMRITNEGGAIDGNALINADVSGAISTQGVGEFQIFNENIGSGGGSIGSDATINVSAANISTGGSLFAEIFNSSGGSIGASGGSIGGGAMIDVTAANITANSLVAQIDNTGGSIGASTEAGAAINMNVSGTASVTTDATVAIYGSDGAVGGAGININGGNYNVGGTFLSYIDGNGTITFNNASAHADVLKAGVFGANGALNISGGTLSADSTLKLYAPGSNGQLNFMSNVTLGGNSVKILAANSVTIFNNIVVTIGGPNAADVYTNHANYTGFGGNGTTTGTFAGAGANDPQPLINAPPFGPSSPSRVTTGGNIPHGMRISPRQPSTVTTGGNIADVRRARNVIHVSSSDELLSLLDRAAPGPGGKITIPRSKSTSNSRNSNRTDVADRLKAGSRVNADRRAMDMRTASSSVIRRSPQ